jgi:Mg2+ and Co2+ transporter CorA
MKFQYIISFIALFIATACGKGSHHEGQHDHDNANNDNPNQALYDQVMDVHDELMPQMEDLYKLKKELQEKIAATPDMVAEKKGELDQAIATLDSADQLMMDWMHKFRPLPDSANQEKAREYLESEMEKVKKLKELFNESIDKAKEIVKK